MKDTIFYVGGSKGGVGKSIVALTLVQFLINRYGDAKTVHVIETDESNPDVGRVYRGKIPMTSIGGAILEGDEAEGGVLHLVGGRVPLPAHIALGLVGELVVDHAGHRGDVVVAHHPQGDVDGVAAQINKRAEIGRAHV